MACRRLRAPTVYAAEISPDEWLVTAVGSIPQERSSRTSAICTATQIGMLTAVSLTRVLDASRCSSSISDQSAPRLRSWTSASSSDARKTG